MLPFCKSLLPILYITHTRKGRLPFMSRVSLFGDTGRMIFLNTPRVLLINPAREYNQITEVHRRGKFTTERNLTVTPQGWIRELFSQQHWDSAKISSVYSQTTALFTYGKPCTGTLMSQERYPLDTKYFLRITKLRWKARGLLKRNPHAPTKHAPWKYAWNNMGPTL